MALSNFSTYFGRRFPTHSLRVVNVLMLSEPQFSDLRFILSSDEAYLTKCKVLLFHRITFQRLVELVMRGGSMAWPISTSQPVGSQASGVKFSGSAAGAAANISG